ncbi:MAG: hypothetical protein NUV94_00610 [Candidatus Acetothermia bacterium]|nr:hypothetical protein [Candidatus Acetothermia bacterium]
MGLGCVLCRVLRDPARWLLTLHVARPGPGKIVAAAVERYMGGWWPVLHALRRACSGGEGGEGPMAPRGQWGSR